MSDGRTHAAASLGVAGGFLIAGATSVFLPPEYVALGSVGAILGTVFSPDLDVDNGFRGNAVARSVGLGWFYHVFWEMYRRSITHRNWRSHGFVISTVLRVLYIFVPITVLFYKNQPTSVFTLIRLSILPTLISLVFWVLLALYVQIGLDLVTLLPVLLGLLSSDIMHTLFDKISF